MHILLIILYFCFATLTLVDSERAQMIPTPLPGQFRLCDFLHHSQRRLSFRRVTKPDQGLWDIRELTQNQFMNRVNFSLSSPAYKVILRREQEVA